MKKLGNFAPVGRDVMADLRLYAIGFGIAFFFSLSYFVSLGNAVAGLHRGEWIWMTPFVNVLGVSLNLFPALALLSLVPIIIYYQMHWGSSKSIYLMRRIPDRWDLHRRCLTLPILMAVISLLMAVVLFWLYYGIYLLVTPEGALYSNQMDMLLGNWLRGETLWQDGVAIRWK